MKITFISKVDNLGTKNKIEFTSDLKQTTFGEFTAYEFVEPQAGEMNRIEVSETKVNIFAGRNTINLVVNENSPNEYMLPTGQSIVLVARLNKVENKNNNPKFEYSLYNNGSEIGSYKIELKITE